MSDPISSQENRPPRRWPLTLLLLPCSAYSGYMAGLLVGVLWFGSAEQPNLAGLFGVLLGGGLGGVAGFAIGGILSWRASYGLLRRIATAGAVLAALLLMVDLVLRAVVRAKHRDEAGLNDPLPPPANFRIEARLDTARLTIDGSTWRATWTRLHPRPETCTARLSAREANGLLRKRDEFRDSPTRTSLCSVAEADATYFFALREADPGAPSWEIFADSACLQGRDEIRELHRLLWYIPLDSMADGRIECKD